jgi:hypothetical protein
MMNSFNKMHVCGLVIVLSLAVLACGTVQAGVVNVATYSSANELAFDSQISAIDLINIGQPSFLSSANTVAPVSALPFTINGTNDGESATYGADGDLAQNALGVAKNTWYLWTDPSTTLTYTLNTDPLTGGSAAGYDITGVNVFAGWRDLTYDFNDQNWTLQVATVANPIFTDVKAVTYDADTSTTRSSLVSLTDSTGKLATGVTGVRFFVEKQNSMGIVFREIDVIGAATVPEPSTIALLGIASLAGLVAVRRRRA